MLDKRDTLIPVEFVRQGLDRLIVGYLATARVVGPLPGAEALFTWHDVEELEDVCTYGYPFSGLTPEEHAVGRLPILRLRALRGYVVRRFYHDQPGFGITLSYELDMPAPEGLSGAPLMTLHGEVVGVVYGSLETTRIAEWASVDEEGNKTPEVQRIVSFAHHMQTLVGLSGAVTGGKPLREFLLTG